MGAKLLTCLGMPTCLGAALSNWVRMFKTFLWMMGVCINVRNVLRLEKVFKFIAYCCVSHSCVKTLEKDMTWKLARLHNEFQEPWGRTQLEWKKLLWSAIPNCKLALPQAMDSYSSVYKLKLQGADMYILGWT